MERTQEDLIETLKSQALENAPVALTLIDLQGKRLWANKAFCQLLGKPPEALLGVSVELAYPLEEQERVKRALVQETIQNDGIKNFETWFERNGKKIYVQIHTSLIRDEQGRPNAIVYSAADISAQRNRMEVLMDSLANGVCVADSSGGIHYANPSYAAFMEKPKEALFQEGWYGVFPQEERGKVAQEFARLENAEDPNEEIVSERAYLLPNGQRRIAKRVLRPIVWEGKRRVLVNINDITEIKAQQTYVNDLIGLLPVGLLSFDTETTKIYSANQLIQDMLGFTEEELHQKTTLDLLPKEYHASAHERIQTALQTNKNAMFQYPLISKDGSNIPVLISHGKVYDPCIQKDIMVAFVVDVSKIEHTKAFYEAIIELSADGIITASPEGRIRTANKALRDMLGLQDQELGSVFDWIHPEQYPEHRQWIENILQKATGPVRATTRPFMLKTVVRSMCSSITGLPISRKTTRPAWSSI